MSQSPADLFWQRPISDRYRQAGSSASGLSAADAIERLKKFRPNAVAETPHRRLALKIAKRFAEPLVAILLVAAAISAATGDAASFAIIVIVVVLSIALDIVQEHKAEAAADALKRSVAIHADVHRDNTIVPILVEHVVPGDVVELRPGDLVPVDGVVVKSRELHVNEALMTGEPFPAEKRAGSCDAQNPADAFNALFAGTSVVNGEATMLVVATGNATRFGGIATALGAAEPPSAFERGIARLGMLILRLTIFLVLFVLLAHITFGRPVLESFLFAVALAVGLTPELLPMIMTVTLSRGALRMAAKSEAPPEPLDCAIIFAPVGALVPAALKAVRKGGRVVVCAGIHMSDIPSFAYRLLWEERQIVSVANLTRDDARAFFAIVPQAGIVTETAPYPLAKANEALADLRAGRLQGAAVLVP
jgi:Mg2+-importing ATPase